MKPTHLLLEEFERLELETNNDRERIASIYRGRAVAVLRAQDHDDDWAENEVTWPKVPK